MNRMMKLGLAVTSLSLVACGPGAKIAPGKQGAAEALYAASGPTSGAVDGASGVDVGFGGDISASCRHGGKAVLKGFGVVTDLSGGLNQVATKYTVAYENCGTTQTSAGVCTLNGSWEVVQKIETTSASALVEQSFKGKVFYNGACDDFIEADVSQRVAVGQLNVSSGAVSVNLVGRVSNASGSYDFNEAVNVTAGNLSVQVTKQ
jgi:hypothetical protein